MDWFRTFLTETTEQTQEIVEETTNSLTGMSDLLTVMMMVLLFACGVYGLYTVIKLRRTYMLFPNKFLYPGNCKPEDCLDEDGFIDYILPRMTIWSIVLLVLGAGFAVNNYLIKYSNQWVELAIILLPVAVCIWLILIQRKAAKLFWNI